MADQEQLERLKRSVEEWNEWRYEHPYIRPDLNGANLRMADLGSANFSSADLSYADFVGANLSFANLSFAYLGSTNLSAANLGAANIRETDLASANFSFAKFSETDLSGAHFFYTILAWVDLSKVKGLETTIHDGPSNIDINSVTLPHDESTRLHFLRGVGFTEAQIENLPSLISPRPIEYSSLFISFAHQDEAIAKQLYTDLCKKGVSCWFAPHDLQPGTPILRGIEEAIHKQDKLLLILSEHAVSSAWIEREVDAALHQEIRRGQDVLFPIRLDNAVLESKEGWATRLQHRHIGDFTNWRDKTAYQQAFTTLLRHLKVPKP